MSTAGRRHGKSTAWEKGTRLIDGGGRRFVASQDELMHVRDKDEYMRNGLFRHVHPACRDCRQLDARIERTGSEDVIASANCKGQLETVEHDVVRVTMSDDPYETLRPTMKTVRRCPDEIKGYRGKEITGMLFDEISDARGAQRDDRVDAMRYQEKPNPEPKKYDQFGDW